MAKREKRGRRSGSGLLARFDTAGLVAERDRRVAELLFRREEVMAALGEIDTWAEGEVVNYGNLLWDVTFDGGLLHPDKRTADVLFLKPSSIFWRRLSSLGLCD